MKNIEVIVKGPGNGRESAIKSTLTLQGLTYPLLRILPQFLIMGVDHQKEEEFKLIKERKVINKNWKELIKPKKIEFVKDNETGDSTTAELIAEPLEKRLWSNTWQYVKKGSFIFYKRSGRYLN